MGTPESPSAVCVVCLHIIDSYTRQQSALFDSRCQADHRDLQCECRAGGDAANQHAALCLFLCGEGVRSHVWLNAGCLTGFDFFIQIRTITEGCFSWIATNCHGAVKPESFCYFLLRYAV